MRYVHMSLLVLNLSEVCLSVCMCVSVFVYVFVCGVVYLSIYLFVIYRVERGGRESDGDL